MGLSGVGIGQYCRLSVAIFLVAILCLANVAGAPQTARAAATTYTVTALGEPATGSDATCAMTCTLRQAVNASNANDPGTGNNTILFATGVRGTITLASGMGFSTLTLAHSVTITGPGAGLLTVSGGCTDCGVSGANTSGTGVRAFLVSYGTRVALSGFTIANGNSDDGGSGVFNNGGMLSITDCAFANNSAGLFGGAIYTTTSAGTLAVTRSTFTGNVSNKYLGGAIYSQYSTFTVTGSTFTNNQARDEGGAIDNNTGSTGTIVSSTFTRNTAGFGGAIANYADNSMVPARLTMINSTFSDNIITNRGGAIVTYGVGAATAIIGSTVSGNTANGNGGTGGVLTTLGTLTLTDTIVAGNTTTSTGGTDLSIYTGDNTTVAFSGHNNIIGVGDNTNYTGLTNGVNSNRVGTLAVPLNPLLAPLALNAPGSTQTHALLPGSPAIDTGTCTYMDVGGIAGTLATDQRGITRPQGTACDIGAFEGQGFAFSNSTGSGQSAAVSTPFARPLSLTITSSHGEKVNTGTISFTITPGSSGASAVFDATGTVGCTVSVDKRTAVCPVISGSVTSPSLTTNTNVGAFTVVASTTGVSANGNVTYMLNTEVALSQPVRKPGGMIVSGATPEPQPTRGAMGGTTVIATPLPQPVRH